MDREQIARTKSRPEVSEVGILEQRLRVAKAISVISVRLARTDDLNARFDDSLAEVGSLVGADRAYVFQFRESGELMDNTHEWCAERVTPHIAVLQGLQSETFGWFLEKVRQGEVFQISDVSALPAEAESERSILEAQGIRSLLIMHMGPVGRPMGFVGFDNVREAGEWQPEDIDLLRVVSQLMGDALERQRSYQALELSVQYQEAALESEKRYRRLMESLPAIVYHYSNRKGASYWSPQVENILGYSQRDLVEKPFLWHDAIHPNDLPIVDEAIAAFEVGKRIDMNYRILDADGRWHWFHDRSIGQLDLEGEAIIEGLAFDITTQKDAEQALRESEQRYRGIVEDTHALICRFLPDGEIIFVNEAYCLYFEKTAEELVGSKFLTLIPEIDQEIVMRNINVLTVDSPTQSHDHRVITPQGMTRWQRWTNRALFDKEGNVVTYQAIGDDITERKQAEEEIQRYQRDLAHIMRLGTMGEMASGMAHELNQPLTALVSYCGTALLLANSPSSPPQQLVEILERATEQAHRASDMIRHLREFVSKGEGHKELLDLDNVIRDIIIFIKYEVQKSDVKIEYYPGCQTCKVKADKIQIDQVLINLVRNSMEAIGHAKITGGQIVLQTRILPNDLVEVTVTDNGPGINAEMVNTIFDPFQTDKKTGMGIGLSLSRTIIEAQGGKLWVDKDYQNGALFGFELPVSK